MSAPSSQSIPRAAPVGGESRPRYGHLTYTSFDGSGSRGGWQVKEEGGDLTAAERQELTGRIVTRFDVGAPLPTYPTPHEINCRPARLVYALLDGDAAGYWHTVDAGKDATGRPGNVFAHVVLDRRISAATSLRPIQLWGSSHWLRPYGPAEVAAATLPKEPVPRPSGHITTAAVVGFLTGTTVDRQSVFRVLLDAVYAAMAGGRGVLLITDDLDSGPRWIAAISYFMSPGTARRFSWSTHDDPVLAAADFGRGIHLVVVPRDRAAGASAGDWIAIDEGEEPGIGELGSTHRTSGGAVAVTGWSILAEGVLADESLAIRLLVQQDTIAAELGDYGLTPQWPLAVAVRQDQELSEFHCDADHVIADDAPSHVDNVEWIFATVAAAIAATAPKSIADAHDHFVRARECGSGVTAAARRLLRKILSEPEWILGNQLADLPREPVVDLEPLRSEITAALDRLTVLHPADSVQSLGTQLRLVELLNRLGCAESNVADKGLGALISPGGLSALADAAAARPLLDDAAISLSTRELVLRPVLARQPAHVLDAIEIAVWQWLFSDHAAAPVVPSNPPASDYPLLPRYIARALGDSQRPSLTTEAAAQLARGAIFLALAAEDLSDADCQDLVSKLGAHTRLTASELTAVFRHCARRVRPAVALSALSYEQLPTELLATIANAPLPSVANTLDLCAVATARLRTLYRAPRPWSAEHVDTALRECMSTVIDNLPLGHIADLADDLVTTVAVLFTVGQTRGDAACDIERPAAQELRYGAVRLANEVVSRLADMVQTQFISIDWFVAHAVLRRISKDLEPPTLFTDFVDPSTRRGDWVDLLVGTLIVRGAYHGPTNPSAVRDSAWPLVCGLSAEHAEKFFAGYPQAAREWLHDNHIREERQRSGPRWMS